MKFLITYSKESSQPNREPWELDMELKSLKEWQGSPWRTKKAKLKLRFGYPFLVLQERF